MPNIEMKSRYEDLSEFLWKDEHVDTSFFTSKGKLKLRKAGRNGSERN
jgi:hypothetical protein